MATAAKIQKIRYTPPSPQAAFGDIALGLMQSYGKYKGGIEEEKRKNARAMFPYLVQMGMVKPGTQFSMPGVGGFDIIPKAKSAQDELALTKIKKMLGEIPQTAEEKAAKAVSLAGKDFRVVTGQADLDTVASEYYEVMDKVSRTATGATTTAVPGAGAKRYINSAGKEIFPGRVLSEAENRKVLEGGIRIIDAEGKDIYKGGDIGKKVDFTSSAAGKSINNQAVAKFAAGAGAAKVAAPLVKGFLGTTPALKAALMAGKHGGTRMLLQPSARWALGNVARGALGKGLGAVGKAAGPAILPGLLLGGAANYGINMYSDYLRNKTNERNAEIMRQF